MHVSRGREPPAARMPRRPLSWQESSGLALATFHAVAAKADHAQTNQQQNSGTGLWDPAGCASVSASARQPLGMTHSRQEQHQSHHGHDGPARPQKHAMLTVHGISPLPVHGSSVCTIHYSKVRGVRCQRYVSRQRQFSA